MNKNDTIKFRTNSELKKVFKESCEKQGKSMSEMFEVFMKQTISQISSK